MNDKKQNEIAIIVGDSLGELEKTNKTVYDLIIRREEDGFFETHQTSGSLKQMAQEILDVAIDKE
jgi:hypothetical protein